MAQNLQSWTEGDDRFVFIGLEKSHDIHKQFGRFGIAFHSPLVRPCARTQWTDPQIAGFVGTSNQFDMQAGTLAENKTHTQPPKSSGESMVTDHTKVNK
ncbi:DUF4142 domain-containing protein [Burkholderia cepacia]|uniref:DUF4142 domain-containing protein n=1 Tax=Burkholderia cepacia TaxID=292 RepID=UPI00232F0A15|nr:DUF4142 domain-containing protein [Burkholderia cepacia]